MTNYYNFEKFIMNATKIWERYIILVIVCFRYITFKLHQWTCIKYYQWKGFFIALANSSYFSSTTKKINPLVANS